MYTKLFSSIIHSTVWREDMHVKVVWITMLAMADGGGRVFASIPGLADAARVTIPQVEDALSRFLSPDQYSRTQNHEGRRIEVVPGGWDILNYIKYREIRNGEARRIQNAEAQARFREKHKIVPVEDEDDDVMRNAYSKQSKPESAQAEADAVTTVSLVSKEVSKEERENGAARFEAWWGEWKNLSGKATTKKQTEAAFGKLPLEWQESLLLQATQAYFGRRAAAETAGVFVPDVQDSVRFITNRRWEDESFGVPSGDNGHGKMTKEQKHRERVLEWFASRPQNLEDEDLQLYHDCKDHMLLTGEWVDIEDFRIGRV